MKQEAEELSVALKGDFGDDITIKFVDVSTDELNQYPNIAGILPKVRLPLTVINNEPRFHGGISAEVITNALKEMQQENQEQQQ